MLRQLDFFIFRCPQAHNQTQDFQDLIIMPSIMSKPYGATVLGPRGHIGGGVRAMRWARPLVVYLPRNGQHVLVWQCLGRSAMVQIFAADGMEVALGEVRREEGCWPTLTYRCAAEDVEHVERVFAFGAAVAMVLDGGETLEVVRNGAASEWRRIPFSIGRRAIEIHDGGVLVAALTTRKTNGVNKTTTRGAAAAHWEASERVSGAVTHPLVPVVREVAEDLNRLTLVVAEVHVTWAANVEGGNQVASAPSALCVGKRAAGVALEAPVLHVEVGRVSEQGN